MSVRSLRPGALLSIVIFSACGNDMSGMPDGGPPRQATTVQVLGESDQEPVANIPVVTHDASGTVLQVQRSGPDGKVTLVVPPGGSISTFQTDSKTFASIDTVIDPPPGATIPFVAYSPIPGPQAPATLQLSLTDLPVNATTLRYVSTCGSGGLEASTPLLTLTNCTEASQDVLVTVLDQVGAKLGWGALLGIATAPGQSLMKPLSVSRTDFATLEMQITGVPSGTGAALRLSPPGALRHRLQGNGAFPDGQVSKQDPPGGMFTATLSTPAGLSPAGYQADAFYRFPLPDDWRYIRLGDISRTEQLATLPARLSFDAGPVQQVRVGVPDLSEPLHPRVSWQGTGFGDYLVAYIDYQAQGPLAVLWTVQGPPGHAPSLRLPDVPVDLAAFAPRDGGWTDSVQVSYVDDDDLSGYAATFQDWHKQRQSRTTSATGYVWMVVPTPVTWIGGTTGQTAALYSVWHGVAESDSTWAVGTGGLILEQTPAGWRTTITPTAADLYAVAGAPNVFPSELLAVGAGGTAAWWTGDNWRTVPSSTDADLYGVAWDIKGEQFWAAGAGGLILRSGPIGTDPVFTAVPSGTAQVLRALAADGSGGVWAVGDAGTVLRWNGSSFSAVSVPSSADLTAVWVDSKGSVWVTSKKGEILRYDGSAWKLVYTAKGALYGIGGSQDATSWYDAWAVGAGGILPGRRGRKTPFERPTLLEPATSRPPCRLRDRGPSPRRSCRQRHPCQTPACRWPPCPSLPGGGAGS